MSEVNIYLITLENNKFFIYLDLSVVNETELMKRCEYLYDFVKKHKPLTVTIIDTIRTYDEYSKEEWMGFFGETDGVYNFPNLKKLLLSKEILKVDYHVKRYMLDYGVENVRGGSYYEEELPFYLEEALEHEFNTVINSYSSNKSLLSDVEKIIKKIDENDLITNKKEYLEKRLNKFKEVESTFSNLKFFTKDNIPYIIGSQILNNIKWLKNKIIAKNNENDLYENNRYEECLMYFKEIIDKNSIIYDDANGDLQCHLHNPRTIFDKYIFCLNSDNEISTN